MSHIWISLVTHMKSHVTHMNAFSHIKKSRITHMNESCHSHMNDSRQTHEEVTSYIWISHVTHQHHTYECNRWVRLRDLVPDLEIGYKTAKYRSTKVELFFSVKIGSAGLHKVAKTLRAMQGADGKDASLARPSAAPSGSESCAACPVLIPCDWPLRFWLA